jgi:hypothetical protein
VSKPFRILTAQGVGDAVWTMFKARDIARKHGCDTVEMLIGGWERSELECRCLPLLRRFPWVSSARFFEMPKTGKGPMLLPVAPTDEKGRYRYIPDGEPPWMLRGEVDFVAVPNRALEEGTRLEDWLPEYECDWDMFRDFTVMEPIKWECFPEQGRPYIPQQLERKPYVVFFMGADGANHPDGHSGHNRGALWTPEEWAALGDAIVSQFDLDIVVVGAGYDRTYYERRVEPLVKKPARWHSAIAEFTLCESLAICAEAKAVISYQSGIGIMSHYLGTPTAIWWRPEGDSISTGALVTFDERMASAWAYPDWQERGNFLPMIYGRETGEDILAWLARLP